jgi:hypothetical protein
MARWVEADAGSLPALGTRRAKSMIVVMDDARRTVFAMAAVSLLDRQPNDHRHRMDRLIFPPSERASVTAGFLTAATDDPAWFARNTDGGAHRGISLADLRRWIHSR